MPAIDYRRVRDSVNLQAVLDLIGYRCLRICNWSSYGPCPLACSSRRRCCSFNLRQNLWMCHKCKLGGNQLDLYVRWTGLELFTAALHLCEFLHVEVPYLHPFHNQN